MKRRTDIDAIALVLIVVAFLAAQAIVGRAATFVATAPLTAWDNAPAMRVSAPAPCVRLPRLSRVHFHLPCR